MGSPAPDFDLPVLGQPWRRVALSGLRGRPVILVFNCGCEACNDFDRSLAAAGLADAQVVAVTGNPSAYEGGKLDQFRRTTGFRWPILVDERMETTLRYNSADCPRSWVIDRKGVIRYERLSGREAPGLAVRAVARFCRRL